MNMESFREEVSTIWRHWRGAAYFYGGIGFACGLVLSWIF